MGNSARQEGPENICCDLGLTSANHLSSCHPDQDNSTLGSSMPRTGSPLPAGGKDRQLRRLHPVSNKWRSTDWEEIFSDGDINNNWSLQSPFLVGSVEGLRALSLEMKMRGSQETKEEI